MVYFLHYWCSNLSFQTLNVVCLQNGLTWLVSSKWVHQKNNSWLVNFPTHLKNIRKSNWILPNFWGENKKYLRNHLVTWFKPVVSWLSQFRVMADVWSSIFCCINHLILGESPFSPADFFLKKSAELHQKKGVNGKKMMENMVDSWWNQPNHPTIQPSYHPPHRSLCLITALDQQIFQGFVRPPGCPGDSQSTINIQQIHHSLKRSQQGIAPENGMLGIFFLFPFKARPIFKGRSVSFREGIYSGCVFFCWGNYFHQAGILTQ